MEMSPNIDSMCHHELSSGWTFHSYFSPLSSIVSSYNITVIYSFDPVLDLRSVEAWKAEDFYYYDEDDYYEYYYDDEEEEELQQKQVDQASDSLNIKGL